MGKNNFVQEAEKQQVGGIAAAKHHLDSVSEHYFDAINKCDEEEFLSFKRKLEPIARFSKNPHTIVSVGVGGGLELRVLADIFKGDKETRIIGVDLSEKAIDRAGRYLAQHNVQASLVQSSAIQMPFKYHNSEINGIVLSAVMHEIYSYVEDGKDSWKKAIEESVSTLSQEGILLLRDFAAPKITDDVKLSFLDDEVKVFYNYFRRRFRTFKTWNKEESQRIKDKRTPESSDYPPVSENDLSVVLPFGLVAEFVLHYKNYSSDYAAGSITPFPNSWKEIDERYLIPSPESVDVVGRNPMSPAEYQGKVIECANKKLEKQGYKLECVLSRVETRPRVKENLKKHFSISHETQDQDVLFEEITSKMELVFKKSKK